jgi:hypothetical protein
VRKYDTNLFRVLNYLPFHREIRKAEGAALFFHNFQTRWCSYLHAPAVLPPGEDLHCPLGRRLGVPMKSLDAVIIGMAFLTPLGKEMPDL